MRKMVSALLFLALLSASALYGQSSFFANNTMTIFKDDVDKLADVNDYGEVDINKASVFAGGRYGGGGGIMAGFATRTEKLHFGLFYEGNFWSGNASPDNVMADVGVTFNNEFSILLGNENLGGFAFNLDFLSLRRDKDILGKQRWGSFGLGAFWGKNFGSSGIIKPEFGFYTVINMEKTTPNVGPWTGKGRSWLYLRINAEYLFAREENHQTTLYFGYLPSIGLRYKPSENAAKADGAFSNTIFFELKQVYDLSSRLSLGYLVGLDLVMDFPAKDNFGFGFFPRMSAGLVYKAGEKFAFNTGVRLGSFTPVHREDYTSQFGLYFEKTPGFPSDQKIWRFQRFQGTWGLGLLWQPEKIFSADFSIQSGFTNVTNINFNILLTLNL